MAPQTTARETVEPELFHVVRRRSSRGDAALRPSGLRSGSSGAPWRQLVVAAPGLPALDAPVPLVVEQLADVLLLVEAKEREEDARMDQLEDMMFSGQSVSAADREAWRRWAQAGSTQRSRKKKNEEEEEEEEAAEDVPEVMQLEVPAVLLRSS